MTIRNLLLTLALFSAVFHGQPAQAINCQNDCGHPLCPCPVAGLVTEHDWGVFSVPVDERNFRCTESLPKKSLEFFLMPSLISKNEFRASDSGIKLEHHFAYYFTDQNEDTCAYKRRLSELAANNGGYLSVRLVTFDAGRRRFTAISEYGVTRCIEETREKLRVELPGGVAVISDERDLRTLGYGKCPAD